MTFGENLINLRKKNKMTQEAVAEKLKITRQTVSNWELNQTKPDLDQLKDLSKLYKMSIDALVNNEIQKIEGKKHFKKSNHWNQILNFVSENKKVLFMIFTLLCIITIGVCLLVDYAMNTTITWGYIPVISIVFAYINIIPLVMNRRKIQSFLCVLTITLLPYLYCLEKTGSVKEWFYPFALFIGTISLCGIWISYFICRFLKINLWYKGAMIIFLWGAMITPIVNYIADQLPYLTLQNFISVFSCTITSLVCIICGYIKESRQKRKSFR